MIWISKILNSIKRISILVLVSVIITVSTIAFADSLYSENSIASIISYIKGGYYDNSMDCKMINIENWLKEKAIWFAVIKQEEAPIWATHFVSIVKDKEGMMRIIDKTADYYDWLKINDDYVKDEIKFVYLYNKIEKFESWTYLILWMFLQFYKEQYTLFNSIQLILWLKENKF